MRLTGLGRGITALPGAACDDELGNTPPQDWEEPRQLVAQLIGINWDSKALTAIAQSLQMAIEQRSLTIRDPYRLE
ncbi:hypothetical protein PsSCT_38600 [Pseudomonas sp. SCT]